MWHELIIAACLVLVIEGVIPFLSPNHWREAVSLMSAMSDRQLRLMGLGSMVVGTVLLYIVNS